MRSCPPFPPVLPRCARFLAAPLVMAALGCGEDAQLPTSPEIMAPLTTSAAAALAFQHVSAGGLQTCGLTTQNQAYCWGYNVTGALGDGTTTTRLTPVAVVGGLSFRQVDAGVFHTCAVATDNRAYCWGLNRFGGLGDGTTEVRLQPVPVAGGHLFRQVDVGRSHTCGRTIENRVYCWGNNGRGQLGNGTDTGPETCDFSPCHTRPVAVAGGLRFRLVSAGGNHTCGVATNSRSYCWGDNPYGQIGDRSRVARRLKPSLVAGEHEFRQLEAGDLHTCAVTTGDQAFCWGNGQAGQIGDGTNNLRFVPKKVAGGHSFTRVTTEGQFTCGETAQNRAYCWGANAWGQLGDGTRTHRLTPVPVAGGLLFSQLSAGSEHTCGKTSAGAAYCWGLNGEGELGDGTSIDRLTPVPVAGTD